MNPANGIVFQYKPREGAEELIHQRISDITISMKALDYLNMPDCIPTRYEVEMNAEERKLYKILGYRIEFEGESLYVFDLVAAEVFHEWKKKQTDEVMPTEVSAENKEEAQPVNTRKGYYPDDIAGSFGVPVEQHRQESEVRQMDGYVSVGMLTGLPGQQQNI